MKKEEIVTKLESAGDADYILRSQDEEKTFLDNYKASILENEVGAKSELYKRLEDDIFGITGVKKQKDEQLNKYIKGTLSSMKSKAERVDELESEITELRKNKPDDAKLQEIKDLQKQITKIKTEHESELTEIGKRTLKNSVKSEIERGLMNLKIKPGIPEAMKQVYIDSVIEELSKNAEIRDGKIVFLDAEGKALRDNQTMAPYTAEALLKERMKDVVDTGKPLVKGPGIIDNPIVKDDKGNLKTNFILPGDIKDKGQLGEYLVKELGLKSNSKEYRAAYAELSPGLPPPK